VTKFRQADDWTVGCPSSGLGVGHTPERDRALRTGCDDFLAKPYYPEQMRAIIEKHLRASQRGGRPVAVRRRRARRHRPACGARIDGRASADASRSRDVLVIGVIDLITGPDFGFAFFYFIPMFRSHGRTVSARRSSWHRVGCDVVLADASLKPIRPSRRSPGTPRAAWRSSLAVLSHRSRST